MAKKIPAVSQPERLKGRGLQRTTGIAGSKVNATLGKSRKPAGASRKSTGGVRG